jgi:hypothetical protein
MLRNIIAGVSFLFSLGGITRPGSLGIISASSSYELWVMSYEF